MKRLLRKKKWKNEQKRAHADKDSIEAKYRIMCTLGSGSFAVVKLAVNYQTREEVAIKIIDKGKIGSDAQSLKLEVDILRNCQHENIIQLKDTKETDSKFYLVMELVTGGELFDRIVQRGHYSEADAAKTVRDIVSAVAYLHEKNIVHRDLKPENLLLASKKDDSAIKIGDFGLSSFLPDDPDQLLKAACGTPGYVAPEVLVQQGYGIAVDMWSIGVILYILLCGFPPFYDDDMTKLYTQIIKGEYTFPDPYWSDVSEHAKDLIKKMICVNPNDRITAKAALDHPWLKYGGKDLPTVNREMAMQKLTEFNARRKFKAAVHSTIVLNRLRKLSQIKNE